MSQPPCYPPPGGHPAPGGYPAPAGHAPAGAIPGARPIIYEFELCARNLSSRDVFSKSDPFLILYADRSIAVKKTKNPNKQKKGGKKYKPDGNWVAVYKSENYMNNKNPIFRPFTLDLNLLTAGNLEKQFLIEVLDWDANGAHDLIGRCTTTIRELGVMKEVALINPRKVGPLYHNSGMLIVQKLGPAPGQPLAGQPGPHRP
eukprot:TRINITY_DN2165_c0_g1_i3.p1 TRINITY_DN2165_c0_g1~~TRINITY_DN2165_c0_g1_i3.p1  ORF type:complete len:223 (+),score=55.97 TRINITY_DN2165_c0_g1_i3:64-669(+)